MSEETEMMEQGQAAPGAPPDVSADVSDNALSGVASGQEQETGADYAPAEFDDLNHGSGERLQSGEANLDVILDIPVTLSMEIGRTQVSIQELLQLAKGSVVELDRMVGEPLDVLVNGTLVARGEVVVVNDKFGVRLNDVISPADRVQKLK
jgi:flagellar motor switch protein FliN/FliY